MEAGQVLILSILQGILEWLPVSSEGQLFLASLYMGVEPDVAIRLAISMHFGTGLAAFFYYSDHFLLALSGDSKLLTFLAVGTLTSAIVGAPLLAIVVSLAQGLEQILSLAVGGLLILLGFWLKSFEGRGGFERDSPTIGDAVLTGLAQGLAVLPGVSRSAITVAALLSRGYDSRSAIKLSFMLGAITTTAAGLLEAGNVDIAPHLSLLAAAVSMIVGLISIRLLDILGGKMRMSSFALLFGLISLILSITRALLYPA